MLGEDRTCNEDDKSDSKVSPTVLYGLVLEQVVRPLEESVDHFQARMNQEMTTWVSTMDRISHALLQKPHGSEPLVGYYLHTTWLEARKTFGAVHRVLMEQEGLSRMIARYMYIYV